MEWTKVQIDQTRKKPIFTTRLQILIDFGVKKNQPCCILVGLLLHKFVL